MPGVERCVHAALVGEGLAIQRRAIPQMKVSRSGSR